MPPTPLIWAASGEHVGGALRSEDVVDPPVERRRVWARPDAGVITGERDPCTREQPQRAVALALELAFESAALDELLRERGKPVAG